MSRTPAWLAEVFAQDDANRAAVRESERRRALVTKRFDGCIHKTNENALVRKAAEPVQPSGTMSAAEQEPWDTWCDRRADERIFALFKPGAPMGDVIAE